MLQAIVVVVLLWAVCALSSYALCRGTYGWSKKKSALFSCFAFPLVFFMTDLFGIETLSRNDWGMKPKRDSLKRVRYREKVL